MRWSDRVSEADWIAPRLAPFHSGQVISVVPEGFAAYARVLHPAESPSQGRGRTVRWAHVSAWSGVPLTRDTQFHDIAMPRDEPGTPAPWDSQGPCEGSLTGADARTLTTLLRRHTTTPQQCWFALWDGYGWDNAVAYTASTDAHADTEPQISPDPVPAEVRHGPRVRLPDRDYLLYTGPVEDALGFMDDEGQTPNLWWPADQSWCVASEIDLPWTYVGGTTELIEQAIADARIEALPASPRDDHHLRVTGWLADRIDTAVDALLARGGETTVETTRGTVWASFQRPRAIRNGWLRTSRQGRNGVWATGGRARLSVRTEPELRRQLHQGMMHAVIGLVDG